MHCNPSLAARHPLILHQRVCMPVNACCHTRQRPQLRCSASAGQPLSIHVGETTVNVPVTKEQAAQLRESVQSLLKTFAEKQKAERPKRWDMMEYRLSGEEAAAVGLRLLEVMCNPNAYTTAFDAKVLITVATTAGVKITTEGRVSSLKQDVEAYLEQP